MDLLSIIRAIWRRRLATIPVILLTALAALYVLAVRPPVYEASSSLLLVNPPPPPTAAQIAADPKLAKINTNNPYNNLGDVWTADALISVVASDSPPAQVALSTDPDLPPLIQITGSASSPQAAIEAASTVTSALNADLYQMQKRQGVNDLYMIKAVELVRPHQAKLSVGGKLRSLIAVLGLGAILLFVVISAAQAMAKQRVDGSTRPGTSARDRPWEAEGPDGDAVRAPGSTASGSRQWIDGRLAWPGRRSGKGAPGTEAPAGAALPSADVIRTALRLTEVAEDVLSADTTRVQSDGRSPGGSAELRARRRILPWSEGVLAHWTVRCHDGLTVEVNP